MKVSGLNIFREYTKKTFKLNLVLVFVLKSKALCGSCSENISLRSSLGGGREKIGTEEGGGENRDWNLNGSSRKAPKKSIKRFSHGYTKTMKWLPYCSSTPICSLCKHFLFSQKITRPLITRM